MTNSTESYRKSGYRIVEGTKSNETLNGSSSSDYIGGNLGNDRINAGAGDDVIDGGAGDDIVNGDAGNDIAVYRWSENKVGSGTSSDVYNGGTGRDTLRLVLTRAEWMDTRLQADIAAYLAFLAANTAAASGEAGAAEFRFSAFNLRAASFEKLEVVVDGVSIDPRNEAARLGADAVSVGENGGSATVNVLANDDIPDLVRSVAFTQAAGGTVKLVSLDLSDPDCDPVACFSYTADAARWQYLASGQTATDSFTYTVTDADGQTTSQVVTVTVVGSNDGPLLQSGTGGRVVEAAAQTGSAAVLGTQGSLAFSDVDLADTHTASARFAGAAWTVDATGRSADALSSQAQAALGQAFAVALTGDSTGGGGGTLGWSFSAADRAFDFLGAGESITARYVVTLSDRAGGSSSQEVSVTIAGANDAPVISGVGQICAGTERSGFFWNPVTTLSAEGTVFFADVDARDTHGASATFLGAVSPDGAILPSTLLAGLPGALRATLSADSTRGATGAVAWDFDLDAKLASFLGRGQHLLLTYEVAVRDASGSVARQPVSVLITGTGGTPDIEAGMAGARLSELAGVTNASTPLSAGGSLTLGVTDCSPLAVSHLEVAQWSGGTVPPASLAAFQAALSVDASRTGWSSARLDWAFRAPDSASDFLAAGETLTLVYRVGAIDQKDRGLFSWVAEIADRIFGKEDADSQLVTITVTGTNDAPVITSAAQAGGVTEDVPALASASGTIAFTDVDLRDGHTPTFAPAPGQTALGAFALTPVSEAANAASGTLAWSYQINPAAAQYLAAGETRTEVYAVTVSDGNGGTATQAVTITVTGTNDAPVITSAAQAGGVTEDVPALASASGTIAFTDVDLRDGHTPTFAPALGQTALGAFALTPVSEAANAASGTLAWSYQINPAAAQFLAAGETRTEVYAVTVSDGNGGTATQAVTITITGDNDLPVAVVDTNGGDAVVEAGLGVAGDALAAGNVLLNDTDVDVLDTRTVTTAGSFAGTYGTLVLQADGAYTYTLNDADGDTQALRQGQAASEVFAYTMRDTAGATSTATLTIAITGTNDAPVVTGAVTGAATEDDAAVTLAALANASDVDGGTVLSVVGVPATLPAGVRYDAATRSFTLDPAAVAYQSLAAGGTTTVSVSYGVSDGTVTTPASVSWTVTGTNDAPVITSTQAPYQIGERLGPMTASGQIAFSDIDATDVPVASLSGSAITAGSNLLTSAQAAALAGAFTVAPNGAWSFSVDGNAFQSLPQDGIVDIRYTVTVRDEAGAEASQVVTIRLAGDNDLPVAVVDTNGGDAVVEAGLGVAGDALAAGNVLLNDTDVDVLDTRTVTTAGSFAGTYGTLVLQADGAYTYTLNDADGDTQALRQGQAASEVFAYTMRDTAGATSTATLTIAITGTNDAPVVTGAVTGAATEDGAAVTLAALANASDVDGGTVLSVVGVPATLPAGVRYDAATRSFTLDPTAVAYQSLAAGGTTTVSVSYGVSDGTVTTPASVSWTVTGTNDAPVITSTQAPYQIGERLGPMTASGQIAFSDIDATDVPVASLSGSAITAGSNLLTSAQAAALAGAFTVAPNGAWSFSVDGNAFQSLPQDGIVDIRYTVTVRDEAGAEASQVVTIRLAGDNDLPVAVVDTNGGDAVVEAGLGVAGDALAAGNVLLNDTDVDVLDTRTVTTAGSFAGTYGTLVLQADGAYTYTLNDADGDTQALRQGQAASEVFAYTMRDTAGATSTATLTIAITGTNDAPVVTGAVTGAATEDDAAVTLAALANASDVDGGTVLSVVGVPATLPAGVRYDAATRSFTLDPAAVAYQSLAAGGTTTVSVSYGVSDGTVTTPASVSWTVTGTNDAPVITSTQAPYQIGERLGPMTASGQIAFSDIDATDVPVASLSGSAITAGSNLLTSAQAAALAGAFTVAPNGAWSFSVDGNAFQSLPQDGIVDIRYTVTVRDEAGAEASQVVTIRLAGDNDLPVAVVDTNGGDAVVEAGLGVAGDALAAGNVLLNDTDVDVLDTRTVTTAGSFAGTYGTLVLQADGAYTYTLNDADGDTQALRQGQAASEVFAYTMRDTAGATSTATLTIAITGTNDAPVVTGAVTGAATEDGAAVTLAALANASDVDGGTVLSVVGVPATLPAGVRYDAATRSFTLDPTAVAYQSLAAGGTTTVSVSYGVSDGTVTTPASVSWTVTGTNDAPVITSAGRSVAENAAGALVATFTVADVDTASGLTFRVLNGAMPDPRFVVVPASGTVLGQPGAYEVRLAAGQSLDFEAENADGQPTITRTIEANDGQGANNLVSAGFTVTVTDMLEAPTAVDDTFATNEDVVLTLTVAQLTGNDTNPPGASALTIQGVSNPVGGTVSIVGGQVVFTPSANVSGTVGFDYTLGNGAGSNVGHVTVDIAPVADMPVVTVPGLTRVSTASNGTQGNSSSDFGVSISADGKKVAFASYASNLVVGDTNGEYDIFVKDLATGVTTRVSTASNGMQANWSSVYKISLSSDGSKIAFASYASNLVPGDTNYNWDIFVKDLATGVTTRVSTGSDGAQAGYADFRDFSLSGDGIKIAFSSNASNFAAGDTNNSDDIFVKDLVTGITTRVSTASNGGQANGSSSDNICLSADGTTVAFTSDASNLVAGDTNGVRDVFVKNLVTGVTTRVSTASNGAQGNLISEYGLSLSANGTKVAFASLASNLVAGDTNSSYDVFVKDLVTGVTTRVSIASDGTQGNGGSSSSVRLSADGTKVFFASVASNLVAGDTNGTWDIFMKDLVTGATTRISETALGTVANGASGFLLDFPDLSFDVSADGRTVVFSSDASNLVLGDTNGASDTFVRRLGPSGAEDTAIALPVSAALADTDGSETLQVRLSGLPAGSVLSTGTAAQGDGSFLVSAAQLAGLSFTPPANYNGTFTLTVAATATEGANGASASTTRTLQVTVTPVNDAPAIVTVSGASVAENAAGALVATFTVTDVDTASGLTFRVLDGATLDPRFVVVPASGTTAGQPGSYEVRLAAGQSLDFEAENADGQPTIARTIEVNDGQGANNLATAGFTVTVTDVPEAPTATDDAFATNEDAALTLTTAQIVANDGNVPGGGALTITGVSGAVNGSVTLSGGTVVFTPAANFSGQARFDYTLSNGIGTDTGTVAVTVAPVADAPALVLSAASLTPVPLGGDVVVNTTTAGQQQYPAVAVLAGGGHVVTWTSYGQDGSGTGVYAQRYDAAGTRQGGEVRVNTTTNNDQAYPSVAALSGGGHVVTWSSLNQDGSGWGIYAQRYDAAGTRQGGEVLVNTTIANSQIYPSVAALSGGGHVVTWMSLGQDGSGWGIYAQRYDAAGTRQGGEVLVNTTTSSDQYYPSVAALSGGGHVVTWTSYGQDGSSDGIYAQRYDAAGTRQGGEVQVNSFTNNSQIYPSVSALSGGGYVVTWTSLGQDGSGWGIYAQRYDAAGTRQGGEVLVNTTTNDSQIYPSVAALSGGGYVVTWMSYGQDGSGNGIYAQRYDAAGTRQGGEVQLNADAAGDQIFNTFAGGNGVAVTADGTLVAVWEQDSGTGEIEQRRFSLPAAAAGAEDTAIGLTVAAALADTDGSETVALRLAGFPAGATFSLGRADGSAWVIDEAAGLAGAAAGQLTMTPPVNWNGTFALSVTATATDTATLSTGPATNTASTTRTLQVTVTPVNDAPLVSASGTSVAENAAGALVATFTVTDVDTASGLTFRVLDGATVDPRFVVVPAAGTTAGQPGSYEVRLAAGQSLDFEAENADGQPTIARTIEVNDGQGANNLATAGFTVTVTDVPEGQQLVNLGSVGFSIDEAAVNDNSGVSVASADDVDGDGLDVPVVGASVSDPGERDTAGSSHVLDGNASPGATTPLGHSGTAGDDRLEDGTANDSPSGGTGHDTLLGGNGGNILIGGLDGDLLHGGAGRDVFTYTAVADSTPAAFDRITDFDASLDRIDLTGIDAVAGGADDAFGFAGNVANGAAVAGQVGWYEANGRTIVVADTTGDAVPDFEIHLDGTGLGLTGGNFLF